MSPMNSHAREVAAILEVVGEYEAAKSAVAAVLSQTQIMQERAKMAATFADRDNAAIYVVNAMQWKNREAQQCYRLFGDLTRWSMSSHAERMGWVENLIFDLLVPF